jgi:FkbM family methyltransferase
MSTLGNFMVMDSAYGKFILPRNCTPGHPTPNPASVMLMTGKTHIEQELNNIFAIINTLPENAIIVDGGANMGFFTIPVAQMVKAKNSKVVSFEPQKQLFYALGGTIALNELPNVFLYNLGIGSEQTTAEVSPVDYSLNTDYGMVTISPTDSAGSLDYSSVDVIPLDYMELPRLDFLKLDIEGFECEALRGAINTIEAHRPWIWIEYNMAGEDNIKKELSSLKDYEYHIVDWQNMLCAPSDKIKASGILGKR